jgi:hypothetical protein
MTQLYSIGWFIMQLELWLIYLCCEIIIRVFDLSKNGEFVTIVKIGDFVIVSSFDGFGSSQLWKKIWESYVDDLTIKMHLTLQFT